MQIASPYHRVATLVVPGNDVESLPLSDIIVRANLNAEEARCSPGTLSLEEPRSPFFACSPRIPLNTPPFFVEYRPLYWSVKFSRPPAVLARFQSVCISSASIFRGKLARVAAPALR